MRRRVVHCIHSHIKSVKPMDGPLYLKTLFLTWLSSVEYELNIRIVERTIESELCLFDYVRRRVVHCIHLHIKLV